MDFYAWLSSTSLTFCLTHWEGKRWCCWLEDRNIEKTAVAVIGERTLFVLQEFGDTPKESMEAYVKKIAGTTLVIKSEDSERTTQGGGENDVKFFATKTHYTIVVPPDLCFTAA